VLARRLITTVIAGALVVPWYATTSAAQGASRPSAADATSTCPFETEGQFGTWTRRPAPLTPAGNQFIQTHAVDPADPQRHYLSDGLSVLVTADDGCTWTPTLTLPEVPTAQVPASAATDRIFDLVVHPRDPRKVWAVVAVGQTVAERLRQAGVVTVFTPASREDRDLTQTLVLRSSDSGRSWQPMTQPALLTGAPIAFAPAPADPAVAYLSAGGAVYASADGGASWQPRPPVKDPTSPARSETPLAFDLTTGPDGTSTLYSRTSYTVVRSTDAGVSWQAFPEPFRRYEGLSGPFVSQRATDGLRLLAGHQQLSDAPLDAFFHYEAGPDALVERPVPEESFLGVPWRGAWHPTQQELLIATWAKGSRKFTRTPLYRVDPVTGEFANIDDIGLSPVLDVGVDDGGTYHVHNAGEIASIDLHPGGGGGLTGDDLGADPAVRFPPAPQACPDAAVFSPPDVRTSRSSLSPARATLPVENGVARHGLSLDLAGDAAALDLFIVLDTSDSMKPAATGLVCGLEELVTGLADDGVDVQVGLAEFWDAAPGTRYQRLVDLAPPGQDLQRALRSVTTRGGEEAHRTALHQAVTGEGLTINGVEHVAPDQGATFRDGTLRVLLHITDEPWDARTPGEPTPFAVIEAMNAAGAKHVGLQVVHRDGRVAAGGDRVEGIEQQALLRLQLDQFSEGTGAVAPTGGLDCDGDGEPDLRQGEPLVCVGQSSGGTISTAGPAVRTLIDALGSRGPVELRPRPAEGLEIEVERRYGNVDVRTAARFDFPVTARCTGAAPVEAVLDAVAGGATVASAAMTVLCPGAPAARPPAPPGDPATEPATALPPPADPPGAALAGAPPAAPPPVVQVPAPAPAPAVAPAAAAAGASAGAASAAGAAGTAGATAAGNSGAGSKTGASSSAVAAAPGSSGASAALAGAPLEPQRRAQGAFVTTSSDVPLAAVPLGGGALAAAALTTHLLATRRRRPAPETVRLQNPS